MRTQLESCLAAVNQVLLGKDRQVRLALACLLARGHLLLEDLPGMAIGISTIEAPRLAMPGVGLERTQSRGRV